MTFFIRANYVCPPLYSGLLMMNPQVKRRSVSCSSCRPPWLSFVAHLQVSDAIFVRFSTEIIFCFSFCIFLLTYRPVSIPFSSHVCRNWSQIPKKSMCKQELCLKILLKIPPSWNQPSAARPANEKWVTSCLSNQDQVILPRAITKIKEKCSLSQANSIQ